MLPVLRNMCQGYVVLQCNIEGNKARVNSEGEKETGLLILFNPA